MRSQLFNGTASFAHFQLLGLCTAGRDQGEFFFESESITEHLGFYLRLINRVEKEGYIFNKCRTVFSTFNEIRLEAIESIMQHFVSLYPKMSFQMDQQRQGGRGYYIEAAFQVWISDSKNHDYLIVDGGFTYWTQKLLSNKKERLLISGMGSERFIFCFALK